jgi:hypothetical protein
MRVGYHSSNPPGGGLLNFFTRRLYSRVSEKGYLLGNPYTPFCITPVLIGPKPLIKPSLAEKALP